MFSIMSTAPMKHHQQSAETHETLSKASNIVPKQSETVMIHNKSTTTYHVACSENSSA